MFKFVFNEDKCSACAACVIACMDQNDIAPQGGEYQRRRAFVHEDMLENRVVYTSASCKHCADAPCVDACPAQCLYMDGETGLTLYDRDKCTGCRTCRSVCPHGAVCFDTDGLINKCDGCIGRLTSGLKPSCVDACPVGALECVTE